MNPHLSQGADLSPNEPRASKQQESITPSQRCDPREASRGEVPQADPNDPGGRAIAAPKPIMRTDLYEAARDYAKRGWSAMPLKGKKPVFRTWKVMQRDAVKDDESFARWFTDPKATGIAIILGKVSGGLYVRDFDDAGAYHRWAAAFPDLAATLPTVRTSKGFHVYARWKGLRTTTKADGELRAEGVYVAAPPSTHPTGAVYTWLVPLPVGDLPEVDPHAAGLASTWIQETLIDTERTEKAERTERTEIVAGCESPTPTNVLSLSDSQLSLSLCSTTGESNLIAHAIEATTPTAIGQRSRKLFAFARHLKAIPRLAGLQLHELKPYVRQWHNAAKGAIGTLPFETTWGDFVSGWPKVRWAIGDGPLEKAQAGAVAADAPAWAATEYESASMVLLVKLCRELQRHAGDASFFLASRSAGESIGETHTTAARWLKVLEADGVLEVTERCPIGGRKAHRYRYLKD